ncbi:TIGR03826 family flagellar region protein [Bacillus atrophaeus]
MGELANCPKCNALFLKTKLQTVCQACIKEEEKAFETVYKFLRKQENRQSTLNRITEETGVEEELILKFIRQKRIQITHLPNLAYPCERCGTSIREGKFCKACLSDIEGQMDRLNQEIASKSKGVNGSKDTYYAYNTKNS